MVVETCEDLSARRVRVGRCLLKSDRGSLGCKANARGASSTPWVYFKVFEGGSISIARRERNYVAALRPTCCPMAKHQHRIGRNRLQWNQSKQEPPNGVPTRNPSA